MVGWVLVGLSVGGEFNVVDAFIGPEELDSISMGGEARAVLFLLVILSVFSISFFFVSVFVGVLSVFVGVLSVGIFVGVLCVCVLIGVFSLTIFDLIFLLLCLIDFLVDLLSSADFIAEEKP